MGDIRAAVNSQNGSNAKHGSWVNVKYDNGRLVLKGTGSGIGSLAANFGDNEVCFALLTLRITSQGIADQPRNIWFHWKGPSVNAMGNIKANQKTQEALDLLKPNHGQIEVLNKTNFNEKTILSKWGAGTGSHVID